MSGTDRRADAGAVTAAGLVLVDKPAGMTSHDVVARCRKAFSTRKVGHAGTLDPMATGVLVVGIERATKLLGLLSLTTKSYTATIRLGAGSDTDDADGTLGERADVTHLDRGTVTAATTAFVGEIDQVPASVSAIKVDGRRAHALMREGVDVELPSRKVTVSRLDVVDTRGPDAGETDGWFDVDVEVDCSSGTYIRSLARDLGASLGVGGHLTVLRRTAVGPFAIDDATPLDVLETEPRMSLAIDDAISVAFPHRTIDDDEAESISQGRWLEPVGMTGVYAAVTADGRVIALLQEKGRRAASVMVVRPATLR